MTSPQTAKPTLKSSMPRPSSPVLIIVQPCLSPLQQSTSPKPILGLGSLSIIATSQISSLTHTIRPSPVTSQPSRQSTIKCLNPHNLSCPLSLTNLTLHHLVPSSLGTAKPRSQLCDPEQIKVDELDFEVCFRCGAPRGLDSQEDPDWSLPWVCKGRCEVAGDRSDAKSGDPNAGVDAEARGKGPEDKRVWSS